MDLGAGRDIDIPLWLGMVCDHPTCSYPHTTSSEIQRHGDCRHVVLGSQNGSHASKEQEDISGCCGHLVICFWVAGMKELEIFVGYFGSIPRKKIRPFLAGIIQLPIFLGGSKFMRKCMVNLKHFPYMIMLCLGLVSYFTTPISTQE